MRRFTPRAPSPAIDNYVPENPEKQRGNLDYPVRAGLRSPVSAFSAALLINDA
jgi:hypothetical protein